MDAYERMQKKCMEDRQTYIDEEGEYWAVGNIDNYTGAVKGIAIDKLAQFENDIESKKLQRLNCNVGDTIYYVAYYKVETDNREIKIIEPWLVDSIVIGKDYQIYRLTHEGTDDYNSAHNVEFGEKWFTDREKALAKLQELKEQNDERLGRK